MSFREVNFLGLFFLYAFFKFATFYIARTQGISVPVASSSSLNAILSITKSAKSYLKSNNLELKDMILFTSRRIKSNEVSNDKWVKRPLRSYWQIISDLVTFLFWKKHFILVPIDWVCGFKWSMYMSNVNVEEIWIIQVPIKWKCSDIIYLFLLLLNHPVFLIKPS